jgi:hypothetical protein
MSTNKGSNVILSDIDTGLKYSVSVENARLQIKEIESSNKSRNIVITDSGTKRNYSLIIKNQTLSIMETNEVATYGKIILVDTATNIGYQLMINKETVMIVEYEPDSMILEFADHSRLGILVIFGGPVNVDGITRDVLSIEVDPSTTSIDKLKEIFSNPNKLAYLYTYEPERTPHGDVYYTKIEVGEGYTILMGVEEVTRKVNQFPGKILPEEYETVYVVTIAQMTYDEWMASGYASIPQ